MEVIRQSLQATVEGSFFPDWEFQTLIGVDRAVVRDLYMGWPQQTFSLDDSSCILINSLGSLVGYPHGKWDELARYVPEGPSIIKETLDNLIALGL